MTAESGIRDTIGLEAVRQVPRVLGLIDRDATSPTYGCADRYFWHYKLHDFPNARFQEASEILALAFLYRHPLNPYHGQARIREWAVAVVRYWERIRRGDGSFDEAYPYERSFCATAFSTMHAARTLMLLSEKPATDLAPIGAWLSRHDAPDTVNQRAASAAALMFLSALTARAEFRAAAARRAASIRGERARAGYFNEYGGPDTGYTSITLSALAAYVAAAGDEDVRAWVRSEAGALGRKLRDNGVYEYAGQSRSTQFFYPYALASSDDPNLEKISRGVDGEHILKPSWMDDRYMVPYAADYLRCAVR